MIRRKMSLALFALLFTIAMVAVASGPALPTAATPQLAQSETTPAAPQVELEVREHAVQLMADPETLLFGGQPQLGCQCRTVADCPWYCNAKCAGAPCGFCAC